MTDLIIKIDFFSGLDEKILRKISDACIVRQFTKNETIVRQGEMGLGLYVISKGWVKVDREQAGVRLQIAELGPEQFFGEMSLLDNKPRAATVTALEETDCLLLTRDSIVSLMNKYRDSGELRLWRWRVLIAARRRRTPYKAAWTIPVGDGARGQFTWIPRGCV